jgi:hypothetical protein
MDTLDISMKMILGGVFAIQFVIGAVKSKGMGRIWMLVLFATAAVFEAQGLTVLKGWTAAEWFGISGRWLLGIYMALSSVVALNSPPSPSYPAWTKWAMLVMGVGFALSAGVDSWLYLTR